MSLFLFIEYGRLILEVEIMSGLIEFLTTEEMILVYVLVGIASVLYFIIYILDKTAMKRKQRQNTRELQKIVLESSTDSLDEKVENVSEEPVLMPITGEMKVEEPVVLEVKESEPVLEVSNVSQAEEVAVMPEVERLSIEEQPVQVDATEIISEESTELPKVEEELQYTSIEPDPSEAQAELMRLTETLEKAEEEVKNIDLTAFEEEQEQNAIISLDELMSRNKALYESGELGKLEDEGNEPISLQDLEERMKAVQTEVESIEAEPSIVAVEESISEPKQTYQPKIKRRVKLGRPRKNKEYSSIRIQRKTTNRINAMQNTLNFKTQDDLIMDLLDKAENSLSADQKTMYKMYLKTFTARGKR